jgi:hypothetical protein
MKSWTLAGVTTLMMIAAPALACDLGGVNYYGHALWQAADQFVGYAQQDPNFNWIAGQVDQMGDLAHHIGDHAEMGQCADAYADFYRELAPAYGYVDSQIDPRLPSCANYYLVQAWHNIENLYRGLQYAVGAP